MTGDLLEAEPGDHPGPAGAPGGGPPGNGDGPDRWRSRLRPGDAMAVGSIGLRAKRGRTLLTALGIAIGIAAMVAVVGISASSRADLLAELDELGTNLLQVQPGSSPFGDAATLPVTAPDMIRRIGPVTSAAATRNVERGDGAAHRSDPR